MPTGSGGGSRALVSYEAATRAARASMACFKKVVSPPGRAIAGNTFKIVRGPTITAPRGSVSTTWNSTPPVAVKLVPRMTGLFLHSDLEMKSVSHDEPIAPVAAAAAAAVR